LKGDKILEGGKALSDNKAVKIENQADGVNNLILKAGSYLFTIK